MQLVHEVLPVVEVNLPASQFAQVWPEKNLPESQPEHVTPSEVDLPAAQLAQVEAPAREIRPPEHLAQSLWPKLE